MIIEEETHKRFGYYPSELSPKSNKRILAACDRCGRVRETCKDSYRSLCVSCSKKGRVVSEQARRKASEKNRGQKHYLYGKHRTEETKRKISETERGKVLTEETRRKMSEARKGRKVSEETKRRMSASGKGRHFSEEHRRRISEAKKGEKHPFYGKHFSEEHRRNLSKSSKEARKRRKGFPTHHTRPEMIYEEICKKYALPYKYTGDSAFWIGKNPSVNPDFVECNGKKIAVEIFSYWHDPLRRFGKVPYSQTYEGRKKILKKYGWKLIVFWQEDLERKDAEAFVLNTLKREGGM